MRCWPHFSVLPIIHRFSSGRGSSSSSAKEYKKHKRGNKKWMQKVYCIPAPTHTTKKPKTKTRQAVALAVVVITWQAIIMNTRPPPLVLSSLLPPKTAASTRLTNRNLCRACLPAKVPVSLLVFSWLTSSSSMLSFWSPLLPFGTAALQFTDA